MGLVNSDGEYRLSAAPNRLIRNTLRTSCRKVVVNVMELTDLTAMTWLLISEEGHVRAAARLGHDAVL